MLYRPLALFLVAAVLLLALGSCAMLQAHAGMTMPQGADAPATPCPFMQRCAANPVAHIDAWQNLFAALPHTLDLSLLFLMVLGGMLFVLLSFVAVAAPPLRLARARLRGPESDNVLLSRQLLHAFATGILNPKLF